MGLSVLQPGPVSWGLCYSQDLCCGVYATARTRVVGSMLQPGTRPVPTLQAQCCSLVACVPPACHCLRLTDVMYLLPVCLLLPATACACYCLCLTDVMYLPPACT